MAEKQMFKIEINRDFAISIFEDLKQTRVVFEIINKFMEVLGTTFCKYFGLKIVANGVLDEHERQLLTFQQPSGCQNLRKRRPGQLYIYIYIYS
jgi:hypothetical protein